VPLVGEGWALAVVPPGTTPSILADGPGDELLEAAHRRPVLDGLGTRAGDDPLNIVVSLEFGAPAGETPGLWQIAEHNDRVILPQAAGQPCPASLI